MGQIITKRSYTVSKYISSIALQIKKYSKRYYNTVNLSHLHNHLQATIYYKLNSSHFKYPTREHSSDVLDNFHATARRESTSMSFKDSDAKSTLNMRRNWALCSSSAAIFLPFLMISAGIPPSRAALKP